MAEQNANEHTKNKTLTAFGGLALFILGLLAFNASILTSFTVVYALGWILVIGGIAGFFLSFSIRDTGGLVLGMVSAVLSFVVGLLIISNPTLSLATMALLLAMFFVVDGVIRIVASFVTQTENKGWSLFYGIVLLALGLAVWARMPYVSLYIFGVFIGIALMVRGVLLVATSTAAPLPRGAASGGRAQHA